MVVTADVFLIIRLCTCGQGRSSARHCGGNNKCLLGAGAVRNKWRAPPMLPYTAGGEASTAVGGKAAAIARTMLYSTALMEETSMMKATPLEWEGR